MGIIGDVTPGITALAAQLPGIISTLAGTAHDDIAQLLTGAQADIDRLVSGELAVIKAAEDPILAELRAWRAELSTTLSVGINGTIGGIPLMIRLADKT